MNTQDELTRALHDQADRIGGHPIGLDDVRGRARGIRRRRWAATAAVTAVVLAVALPVGVGAWRALDRTDPPVAPSPAPSHGAAILHDRVVTLPDGDLVRVDVDSSDVSEFGVLTDGRIVMANSDRMAIQVFSSYGTLEVQYPVETTALTMGPTDETAAWIDGDDVVQVLESGTADPVTLGALRPSRFTPFGVDAVVGDDCASGQCRVLAGDGTTTSREITIDGVQDLGTAEPLRVTDVSPDGALWAVTFPPKGGEQYGCVGLYDPEAEQVTARNCQTSNLMFSPDGEHLLGGRYENNMAGEVTMLDLDLRTVGSYTPSPRVISRAAWADSTHVVSAVAGLQDNQWSLVRTGIDGGEPEVIDGPVAGDNPEIGTEYLPSQ